jgi:hypothetical protein
VKRIPNNESLHILENNANYNLIRRMTSFEILRHVAPIRTDVSEELSASFIRVTRIDELATMLAVTSN